MNRTTTVNRRKHPRHRLPPMYSNVTAQPVGSSDGPGLEGHVYDISEGGVRIELDEPLSVGQSLEFNLDLPGAAREVKGVGTVVWVNDADDDPGPRRMALQFTGFATALDRAAILKCLDESPLRAAA